MGELKKNEVTVIYIYIYIIMIQMTFFCDTLKNVH